jgi:hypothetical protein
MNIYSYPLSPVKRHERPGSSNETGNFREIAVVKWRNSNELLLWIFFFQAMDSGHLGAEPSGEFKMIIGL